MIIFNFKKFKFPNTIINRFIRFAFLLITHTGHTCSHNVNYLKVNIVKVTSCNLLTFSELLQQVASL